MVTTIQVNERTLELLRRLKEQMQKTSYEDTIIQLVRERSKGKSMQGSLKKYLKKGETINNILKELQEDRRKSDRF